MTIPSSKPSASALSIWAALLTLYIVWGSTYLAIRLAVATMPPFYMASLRFLIAGLGLFLWRWLVSKDPLPTRLELRNTAIAGAFLLLGGNGLVSWAEQSIPSGLAALLVSTMPLWMAAMQMLLPQYRTTPSWQTLLGIALGFAGVLLLINPFQTGLQEVNLLGAVVTTLASILWAFGSLYGSKAKLPASPMMGTALEMLCGSAMLALAGTLTGEPARLNIAAISTSSLMGLLYLIVFGSLIAFSAYTWLLRAAPPSLTSTYSYVNPLVAIAIGYLFIGEVITPRTLIAALVIISAVALTTLGSSAASKKAARQSLAIPAVK
jgi:drug/metabolite transporter (DMT)-like permease